MEYLVTMTTRVPDGTSEESVNDIRAREDAHSRQLAAQAVEETEAREAQRAEELAGQGHLLRLWTLPGQGRTLGLWVARDAAEMKSILKSLPLDTWMTVQTTPLTPHPSDPVATGP
jgi:muconolactone D-isomerase